MEKLDYIPTTGWNVEWSGALKKFIKVKQLRNDPAIPFTGIFLRKLNTKLVHQRSQQHYSFGVNKNRGLYPGPTHSLPLNPCTSNLAFLEPL